MLSMLSRPKIAIASNRRRIEQGGEQVRQRGLELGSAMLEDGVSKRVSSRCSRGRLRGRLGLGWGLRGRLCRILILHRAAILSSDFRQAGV